MTNSRRFQGVLRLLHGQPAEYVACMAARHTLRTKVVDAMKQADSVWAEWFANELQTNRAFDNARIEVVAPLQAEIDKLVQGSAFTKGAE